MSDKITIDREVTFRDQDWGVGMFDTNDDLRAVVTEEGRIWLMAGTDAVRFSNREQSPPFDDDGIAPDEARSIAMILLHAASEVDGEPMEDTRTHTPSMDVQQAEAQPTYTPPFNPPPKGFAWAGECRAPRDGDWYWSDAFQRVGNSVGAHLSSETRHILRKLDTPSACGCSDPQLIGRLTAAVGERDNMIGRLCIVVDRYVDGIPPWRKAGKLEEYKALVREAHDLIYSPTTAESEGER